MTAGDRATEALLAFRTAVVDAAESKLARRLSADERAIFDRIGSLMRLEAIERAFSSPGCTAADVERELRDLARGSG